MATKTAVVRERDARAAQERASREFVREIGEIKAGLAAIVAELRAEQARALEKTSVVTEEQVAKLDEFLSQQTDAEAIVHLLTLHKMAENGSHGRLRELLSIEAAAMFHILHRFVPEATDDALALWWEHTEDEDDA